MEIRLVVTWGHVFAIVGGIAATLVAGVWFWENYYTEWYPREAWRKNALADCELTQPNFSRFNSVERTICYLKAAYGG